MPELGARALMALVDPNADPDQRYEGALLVFAAIDDIRLIRAQFLTRSDE
jgi:hypothetical protein